MHHLKKYGADPPVTKIEGNIAGLQDIVLRTLREDIGKGDATTCAILSPDLTARGIFIARSAGVVAGWEAVRLVFLALDQEASLHVLTGDGQQVRRGDRLAVIDGKAAAILTGERVALNILQRMSGIATLTRQFVKAVRGTSAIILDTRKTAPGIRLLDKLAVRIGGGQNHRLGLDDMVLIKENHIALSGSLSEAVRRVRHKCPSDLTIEVEVKNTDELTEALSCNADRILLDNMSIKEMRKAVELTRGRIPLEASGNVSLEFVKAIAATGIQYISIGCLTHSVNAMDISLVVEKKGGAANE